MIYTCKLYRAELFDDHTYPYTNVRAVYEANKDRYPDYDLIVTNAHWYAAGAKPCGNYKVKGKIISQEDKQWLGFLWNDGGKPVMTWSDLTGGENFVGTIPAIFNGVARDVSSKVWGAGVCRPCGRTAWGFKANGDTWLLCTGDAMTPQQVQDMAVAEGVTDLVILDGSGSSQWCTKDGYFLGDGRTIYSYLLLWVPKTNETEDKMKTVCIDPGHGGDDTSNGSPDGTYKEHEFTLDMGKRIKAHLERCGVAVVMTRETDTGVGLSRRAEIANAAGAELYVSLHSNAVSGGWNDKTRGLTVWTYAEGGERNRAANILLDEMAKAGVQMFGSKLYHQKFTVLAKTNMPAYLIECAFHTSRPDVELLLDNQHRDKLALATAKAICSWGGVKWVDAPTEPTKPTDGFIYRAQVGAFTQEQNAAQLKQELEGKGYKPFIVKERRT